MRRNKIIIKKNEPPQKNFAEAQVFKRDKPSRDQESLPGSRQPDAVVAAVTPIAADDEPVGSEVADVDTVPARVETGRPNVNAFEEPDTTDLEIGRDEPTHLGGVRHLLERGEKLVLLVPRLAGRVRNRRLLDQEPAEGRLVLAGELLVGIPPTRLRVEVGGLDLPNVERGHRRGRRRHDGVAVFLAPLEHVLRRQTFGECRDLLGGVNDARASLRDFLRRDEIRAEDGLRQTVVGRFRREATDAFCEIHGEAGMLVQALRAVIVESGLVVLGAERFGGSLSFRTVCGHQCRRVQ